MYAPFDAPRPREVRPGEYPVWDEALALVNRDLTAQLPGRGPLRLMALPPWPEELEELSDGEQASEHVYVTMPDGRWHGDDLGREPDGTTSGVLTAVAEAAQDTVLECLWQVWPVCDEHRLGMHAAVAEGRPVWWCAGGRGPGDPEHVGAVVGELRTPYRPRGVRRKERGRNRRGDRQG
ncbi:hypothetical protein ACIBVL_14865 [Streptomyces sp. NPDC049687]|uniref:hypothetical protein n=1 Tax=Streptomyces sp. NPDC049687 TaxID=3365596 RepID=UPI00379156FE